MAGQRTQFFISESEFRGFCHKGDWTFITNNGVDFRGSVNNPGSHGVYAGISLHAGLICIEAPGGIEDGTPEAALRSVSVEPDGKGDLTNQDLEVVLSAMVQWN